VIELGTDGLVLSGPYGEDEVLDVLLDGRRIWSVKPHAAAQHQQDDEWHVAWPPILTKQLQGLADLAVRDASGTVLTQAELTFGDSTDRATLVDRNGNPMAVDGSGRLVRTFDAKDSAELEPLLDAMTEVLGALARSGVDAFPAYGTLLGAVRNGHLIGHDNDADLAYVSRARTPVDVVRESFRIQRALSRDGFQTTRYSGAAIRVDVRTSAGVIGLDVFGGFFHEQNLVLMGEIYRPFETSWILPLGSVELEGRSLPAPAEPERLLETMYGASWRVPDPTYVWNTPTEIRQRLDAWFRGSRVNRNHWDRRYSNFADRGPARRRPYQLTRMLHRREAEGTTVLDVGCGRGQDVVWLANKGHRAVGVDYAGLGFSKLARVAGEQGLDAAFWQLNLLELRHVMTIGARMAVEPGPRAVLARHFADATNKRGREGLFRASSMALQDGGRLYLQFVSGNAPGTRDDPRLDDELLSDLSPDVVADEASAFGGRVTETLEVELTGPERPSRIPEDGPPVAGCRMVVEW
jgi:SAM-dependent methyltransferase